MSGIEYRKNLPIKVETDVFIAGGGPAGVAAAVSCAKMGAKLYLPPLKLCGDNGAMIGAQGYYEYLAGHVAEMDLNAYATRDIAD